MGDYTLLQKQTNTFPGTCGPFGHLVGILSRHQVAYPGERPQGCSLHFDTISITVSISIPIPISSIISPYQDSITVSQ